MNFDVFDKVTALILDGVSYYMVWETGVSIAVCTDGVDRFVDIQKAF